MNDIEAIAVLQNRLETMDRTLFMGLKCLTTMVEDIEIATDDRVSHEERAIARHRVREVVKSLKSMFG
jgi:hypothetical protein